MEKDDRPLSVLVIVAALNEEEGIGPTLAELREVLEDPIFLVVMAIARIEQLKLLRRWGLRFCFRRGQVREMP
jgi:hypothetical protein